MKDKYLILVIEELLDKLKESKVFSKLDLKLGYHQIRIVEKDTENTTFGTHNRHYEFVVMSFVLTNTPSTIQILMSTIFCDYLKNFIPVSIDDILIYSSSLEDHLSMPLMC